MKIGIGKRILMFLHWFFSLLFVIILAVSFCAPYLITQARELFYGLLGSYARVGSIVMGIVSAAVYAILCVVQAGIIFKRGIPRSERGFITVDSSDNSRVRIAISAVEQMVRQSVYSIDGISDMKIAIENSDDAIEININASILSGCHVPTITLNMQQAIRKFVEMNCGVAVRTVAVSINSVTAPDAAGRKKHRAGKAHKGEANLASAVPVVYDPAPAQSESLSGEAVISEKQISAEPEAVTVEYTVEAAAEESVAENIFTREADVNEFVQDSDDTNKQE